MMLPGKPLSAADANAPPPAKKPKTTTKTPPDPTESIVGKLGVLTNAQLVAVVRTLLERGAVSPELVESIVPAPDLSPLFAAVAARFRIVDIARARGRNRSSSTRY